MDVWYWEVHGNYPWYCMYKAYIEAKDSSLWDVKDYCIGKDVVCGVFSFLKDWLYGVTLPQGFWLIKRSISIFCVCNSLEIIYSDWVYLHHFIYLQVRSITSGIEVLSWASEEIFFFCKKYLGSEFADQIWNIWYKIYQNKYQIWIPLEKSPNFKKKMGQIGLRMWEISLI